MILTLRSKVVRVLSSSARRAQGGSQVQEKNKRSSCWPLSIGSPHASTDDRTSVLLSNKSIYYRMTSSQGLWGEEIPNEKQQKRATDFMRANYPDCVSAVQESLACAREHHKCESDPCRMINERLQFCLVFSYCPEEAEAYAKCVKYYNKPVQMSKHPRGCIDKFKQLDACMTKNTTSQ